MTRSSGYLLLAVVFVGCGSPADPPAPAPAPAAAKSTGPADAGHDHAPGRHGGSIIELGAHSYHAEVVFEAGGTLRLFTLGKNESRVMEVDAQPLAGFVKGEGEAEAESIVLAPKPQPGDAPGMTSAFAGPLPKRLHGRPVEVTIPSLRIGGERFRVGFKSPAAHDGHAAPPASKAADEEKALYLTPGGKYTAADIAANGKVTASAKFKGVKAEHDLKPQPGDLICPVTLTKANPKFAWVVGGKSYQFCCPPCVDEFVDLAKTKPDEVKEPGEYRQK